MTDGSECDMVICLELVADLHMAQLMPLPLTVSCSSKIQIGFTFLVPAHLGSPGQRVVKRVCVCDCVCVCVCVSLSASDSASDSGLSVDRHSLPHALFNNTHFTFRQISQRNVTFYVFLK